MLVKALSDSLERVLIEHSSTGQGFPDFLPQHRFLRVIHFLCLIFCSEYFCVSLTLNKLCKFFAELFGQKKNNPYLCSIACEPFGVKRAVLFYEKDVFGRLSLWVVNLASSYLYSRQMTTKRHVVRFYIPILYSPCWRGLMSVVYPV